MSWLDPLIAFFKRRRIARLPAATFNAAGITQGGTHIPWSSVANIMAYKEDRYTTDLLCNAFFSPEGTSILCTELDHSFVDIADSIRTYLPDTLPHWHLTLMTTPAFELTLTQVYPLPEPSPAPQSAPPTETPT